LAELSTRNFAKIRLMGQLDIRCAAVVHSDPEILGGTPVFVGTRVPLRNLIDYLEDGYTLEEFLDHFPTVSRDQAIAALELAHDALISGARTSG
jgi:uncharacterized protein (DUF433 family)